MDKTYNAKEIEKKYKDFWEKEKIYKFDLKSKKKIYSIDTPPPYASSGHLHVGHALHYTQFEIIARIMRQLDFNVYFPPGFDDNGLPTEKYVEEKLGINKKTTDRAEFRKLCLKETKRVEEEYSERVFKKLGHSYDWDLVYQTISPEAQKISQTVFLKLIKNKNCYRKQEPVIWCPYHETALAQAEVEDLERTTKLNYIDFDIKGEKKKVTIATTRPEFLPACVGIFVNPNDSRFKDLIGKELIVPIFNFPVRVMTDEKVDKDFGTGVVMVCTFGDNTDIEWWKKHCLELKNLLNPDGTLKEIAGKYKGMKIEEAKEKIIQELKKQGRLKKQEPLKQTVGSCWRCSSPVEYITAKQWFIKTLEHKKDLIKRGKQVKWYPDFMRVRYENWVKNLGWDWVISRQRYFGIPIPVWYCNDCNKIILPEERELPIDPMQIKKKCPKCKKQAKPDTDVFDTWMTSSNSPEVACQWLKNPETYEKITPMSLRPQGHDIIRTWAFYTILKSHLLFNRIPWKDLVISTFVLDSKRRGMHKSKGNAIWADEIIEKYGVDTFRYWVGTASIGSDLPFNEQELVAGQRFLKKLWNASRFVFMNLKNYNGKKPKLMLIDEWMLQKIAKLSKEVKELYLNYNIAEGKKKIENFFWHDFSDNYLEIVKDRIYNSKSNKKKSAQYVLYYSLLTILKLIAPITSFITEEIYQERFAKDEKCKSIHISKWPEFENKENKEISDTGNLFIKVLEKVRHEKAKKQKSVKAEIVLTLEKKDTEKLKNVLDDLKAVINAREIKQGKFRIEF
ncbi:MAG: valine--tRNA ligase, partial [Nanoarchaeota archaeon]